MELTGEQLIPAPQAETWAALNDPEVLKACVPGCETIERVSETEFTIRMTARVGPVSAKFKGKLTIADLDPPNAYSLSFEGQGGPAGFGKGGAKVRLAPEGHSTRLSYQVKANVGGKLAQIGSRLIDAAAGKLSNDFFNAFNERMASMHAPAATLDEDHPGPVADDANKPAVTDATLRWLAATALVVFTVALFTLLHA
ncbi:MAG: carbon monoxide dehydrogenase subunit G [Betaproteobacteria bacterium]|nr:carbon monoxide dehydrogenase subunit G [Betaproteobacteria bacterium]